MAYKISLNYSPNFDSKKRRKNQIKFIIFHYTGMKSEKAAIKRLTDFKSEVSCNYFIKKNGEIITMVPDLYIAWHAAPVSILDEALCTSILPCCKRRRAIAHAMPCHT